MKAKKLGLISLGLALALVGCGGNDNPNSTVDPEECEHEYDVYKHDENQHWTECSKCGLEKKNSRKDHNFKSSSNTATCTEGGVETFKCSDSHCGLEKTEASQPLGHDYKTRITAEEAATAGLTLKEATCKEAGVAYNKCTRCGDIDKDNPVTLAKLNDHAYGDLAAVPEMKDAVPEKMASCSFCDERKIQWSALDFDDSISYEVDDSKRNNGQVRFGPSSALDPYDDSASKVGSHLGYKIYVPKGVTVEHAILSFEITSNSSNSCGVFGTKSGDNTPGILEDGSRSEYRYQVEVNGKNYVLTSDPYGEIGGGTHGWYDFPIDIDNLSEGLNTIVLKAYGGYRSYFHNFAIKGIPARAQSATDDTEFPSADRYALDETLTVDDISASPIELYTEKQLAYLNYTETTYAEMTGAKMKTFATSGNAEESKPNPVKITWELGESNLLTGYEVAVWKAAETSAEAKVYTAAPQGRASKKSLEIYNLAFGTTYKYTVTAKYSSGADKISDEMSFTTGAAKDIINYNVDGITNFRDMGGKALSNGGTLALGKVFRSSAFYGWDNGRATISAEGKETLKELGIKTEIDLYGGSSDTSVIPQTKTSDGGAQITYVDCRMNYSGSRDQILRNVEPIVKVFEVFGDKEAYPIDFHCRIGTDRTGTIAFLIEALCGVSKEDIYKDYMFSNFGQIGTSNFPRTVKETTGADSIKGYFDYIESFSGSDLQQKTYNMLRAMGIPAAHLNTIINQLVVEPTGAKASAAYSETATLTSSATLTTVTNGDLRLPSSYYNLSKDGTVTATFITPEMFPPNVKADVYAVINSGAINKNLADEISVSINGVTANIPAYSLATNNSGLESNGNYWVPINIVPGFDLAANTTYNIVITALDANIKIANVTALLSY